MSFFSWYVTLIREWYRTTQERVLWQGSFLKKKIDKTRSPSWLYVMNNLIIQIKQMLKHAQYRCKFCIQVRSAWLDHKRVVCSVPYKTCSCYKSYFWWVSCLEKKIDRPLLPFSINMFTQKDVYNTYQYIVRSDDYPIIRIQVTWHINTVLVC